MDNFDLTKKAILNPQTRPIEAQDVFIGVRLYARALRVDERQLRRGPTARALQSAKLSKTNFELNRYREICMYLIAVLVHPLSADMQPANIDHIVQYFLPKDQTAVDPQVKAGVRGAVLTALGKFYRDSEHYKADMFKDAMIIIGQILARVAGTDPTVSEAKFTPLPLPAPVQAKASDAEHKKTAAVDLEQALADCPFIKSYRALAEAAQKEAAVENGIVTVGDFLDCFDPEVHSTQILRELLNFEASAVTIKPWQQKNKTYLHGYVQAVARKLGVNFQMEIVGKAPVVQHVQKMPDKTP